MGIGFDSDQFYATMVLPLLQDPGLSKRLVFYKTTIAIGSDGSKTSTATTSETTGIMESNPTLSPQMLQQVFPDGDISNTVVKVFVDEETLSSNIVNGDIVDIYKSTTLLGKFRVKYVDRNALFYNKLAIAYCVKGA